MGEPPNPIRRILSPIRRWLARRSTRSGPHARWLARRIAERRAGLRARAQAGDFALLTCIYEGTPPRFFARTAASVFAQTSREFQWVVLAHGPIPRELEAVAGRAAADPRVKFLRLQTNLGIIGGMRKCLEAADGRYVLPLDADDVLTEDALSLFAQAIADHGKPALLYSDEDTLVEGRPTDPYFRPDWDPVLNLSGSYVWHLCAFDRAKAMGLGVYADSQSNFCHDWDTLCRFAAAAQRIVHVPEIAYHWRRHGGSSTNRPHQNEASLSSQKHVLEMQIARLPSPELYDVLPFPIFRGAVEYWIHRKPVRPPRLELILLRHDTPSARQRLGSVADESGYPFHRLHVVGTVLNDAEPQGSDRIVCHPRPGLAGLAGALGGVEDGWVAVFQDGIRPVGNAWPWEAACLREVHQDVALIAGRIVDSQDTVVGGGRMFGVGGVAACPDVGRRADDTGYFSLALKQRSVDAVDSRFFLAEAAFLRSALAKLPESVSMGFLGVWLGAIAAEQGRRVAASPLITARTEGDRTADPPICQEEEDEFLHRYEAIAASSRWHFPGLRDRPGCGHSP